MLCKKGQQRLFCLQKLVKIQVEQLLMIMFYSVFIDCLLSFTIICWTGYKKITCCMVVITLVLVLCGSCDHVLVYVLFM